MKLWDDVGDLPCPHQKPSVFYTAQNKMFEGRALPHAHRSISEETDFIVEQPVFHVSIMEDFISMHTVAGWQQGAI